MDPARIARVDLSEITEERARELLETFAVVLENEVRRMLPALKHCVGIGPEDLVSVAQIAVLEASLRYREDADRTLRSWVSLVVRWRVGATVQAHQRREEALEQPESVLNGRNPEETYQLSELRTWFERQLGALGPRERIIFSEQLSGRETMGELALSMGISRGRLYQLRAQAFSRLRAEAKGSDLGLDALDGVGHT